MHLLVIFVVALIVLGPDKMPEAVRKGARLLGEARRWGARISEELQSVVSLHTEELFAPPDDAPAALTETGELHSTPVQPELTADERWRPGVSPPEAQSVIAGRAGAGAGSTPRSSLPPGYLPLVPKESS